MLYLNFDHWQDLFKVWHLLFLGLVIILAWMIGVDFRQNWRRRLLLYAIIISATVIVQLYVKRPMSPPIFGQFDLITYNLLLWPIFIGVLSAGFFYKPPAK